MSNQFVVEVIASSSYSYVGEAPPNTGMDESKWKIIRISEVAGLYSILSGDGVDSFSLIWNNRCALSYNVSGA